MHRTPLGSRGSLVLLAVGVSSLAYSCTGAARLRGTEFEPAPPAPGFELTDHNGRAFSLAQTHGDVVLLYFGYTTCPDECPLTMAKLKVAFDLLNEDGDDVHVVLVTTDPSRDSTEALRNYLAAFHPSFLGLTGSRDQLEAVYRSYGVVVLDDGETHTNRIYVIDRDGDLRLSFPYEMTASEIASDLRVLLAET